MRIDWITLVEQAKNHQDNAVALSLDGRHEEARFDMNQCLDLLEEVCQAIEEDRI